MQRYRKVYNTTIWWPRKTNGTKPGEDLT